jgi:hypothetical protein
MEEALVVISSHHTRIPLGGVPHHAHTFLLFTHNTTYIRTGLRGILRERGGDLFDTDE